MNQNKSAWISLVFTLMACGRSGNFISLNCCGKFILFSWWTTAAGAADRPCSCLTSLFWSSIRAKISDIFVCNTIPPENVNRFSRSRSWTIVHSTIKGNVYRKSSCTDIWRHTTHPLLVRIEYDAQHQHGILNLIRKHFRSIYPAFRQTLESGQECLVHFLMNQHKIQSKALHSVDKLACNPNHQLNCHPLENCKRCHHASIPAGMFLWLFAAEYPHSVHKIKQK